MPRKEKIDRERDVMEDDSLICIENGTKWISTAARRWKNKKLKQRIQNCGGGCGGGEKKLKPLSVMCKPHVLCNRNWIGTAA